MIALFALGCLIAACPSHSERPKAHPRPRIHSLVVDDPDYGAREIEHTFGSDWSIARPYVDLVVTDTPGLDKDARAAGLRTVLYADVNHCSSRDWPFPNPYAFPDCGAWPATAFYVRPGHPDQPLSAHESILQRILDPGAPQARAEANASIDALLHGVEADLIELDDASPPEEHYAALCWGMLPVGSGCDGAPGGRASFPLGGNYSRDEWLAGMRALVAGLPRKSILNGLGGWDKHETVPGIADFVATAPNVWGAICDGCFFGTVDPPRNKYLWSGPLLREQLEGVIVVTAAKKNVVFINDAVADESARARTLAEIMLAYDPDRSWFWETPCGQESQIHACPEAALTFYGAHGGYPAHLSDLRTTTGAYAREFAACYRSGRPVGPCATVVNADPDARAPLPRFARAYHHTLAISGRSLCACFGESGSLGLNGAPVPDPLPPASAYVLFR